MTAVRRTRALTALAGVALLGITACGTAQDTPSTDAERTTTVQENAPQDEAPQDEAPQSSDNGGADEAPGSTDDATTGAAEDGATVEGSDAGRALVFVQSVEQQRLLGEDGERRLPAQDLAEILQDMGGPGDEPPADAEPAACETDLRYVASADVRCTVTASFDGNDREMVFYAHPITSPGGEAGILYTADEPMTEDARWATFHDGVETVMLGQGGAYGMEPIPADQLARDVQSVVDFDHWRSDIGTEQWDLSVESCESEMDFDRLAPVPCEATDADGSPVTMWALPGTLFGQEPGLIVSAELGADG